MDSKIYFVLVWIGIYCVANSLANPISEAIGVDSSATLIFNLILTVILFMWINEAYAEDFIAPLQPYIAENEEAQALVKKYLFHAQR